MVVPIKIPARIVVILLLTNIPINFLSLVKQKETIIVDGEDCPWWRQNLVLQFVEKGDMKGSSVRSMSLKRGVDLTRPEWQKKRKKMASRGGQASGRAR